MEFLSKPVRWAFALFASALSNLFSILGQKVLPDDTQDYSIKGSSDYLLTSLPGIGCFSLTNKEGGYGRF